MIMTFKRHDDGFIHIDLSTGRTYGSERLIF